MKKLSLSLAMVLFALSMAWAQRVINGSVSDEKGSGLPGASVVVKGTTNGTITDLDGKFSLAIQPDARTIVVSFTGFTTKEIALSASDALNITLSEGVSLNEVVVGALGISRDQKSIGHSSQQVSSDAVNGVKETNILNSLSGKVSGLTISGGSGNLGSSSRILIRGINSITGENQPLFVVDGVPLDNSNFTNTTQARGGGGVDYGNAIQDLNPENVESMNVLKGAAATALYGSRGANGVIVVTTKKGRSGSKNIEVSVNHQMTFENVAVLPKYQNSYGGGYEFVIENGQKVVDFATDESWGPKFDPNVLVRQFYSYSPAIPEYYNKATPWVAQPDNIKSFFETGVAQNNSVSVTGGTDFSNFRLSYTNLNQTGVMPNSQLKRHNLSFSTGVQATSWLNASVSANYVTHAAKGRSGTGYDGSNVMQGFNQWHQRQMDMGIMKQYYKLPDGSQITWNRTSSVNATPKYTDNPYWIAYEAAPEDTRDRLYGNATVTATLGKGLSVTGRVGQDGYTDVRQERVPIGSQDIPFYSIYTRKLSETNIDLILDYKTNLSDKVSLNAFGGYNDRFNNYSRNGATTQGGLAVPNLFNLSNSISGQLVDDYKERRRVIGAFGNVSLGFGGMWYVDLTARNDWSSTLPAGSNSYFYPSVSTSLVLSELPAFREMKWLSFAKVRGNWAQVGNDAPVYVLESTYTANQPFGSYGNVGFTNSKKEPNLKPEITTSQEVGLDLRLFKNRVRIDFALYDKISKNQIIPLTVSPSTGYTSKYINAGRLQNQGAELLLGLTPVKTQNFTWDVTVNWSKNTNKVLELLQSNGDTITNYRVANAPFAVSLNATVGEPFGTIRGRDGYRDASGNLLVDASGNYMVDPTLRTLGSIQPKWTGGINNSFSYKGFQLGFLIDMKMGGSLFSTTDMFGKYSGLLAETAEGDIRENGKALSGMKAKVDAAGALVLENGVPVSSGVANDKKIDAIAYFQDNGGYAVHSLGVFDASFVKLREVRIGYDLPARWLSRAKVKGVNVALVGRNVAILHKNTPHLDPDQAISSGNIQGLEGAQLPSTRTIGFNVGIKF
jgi:TonB-linked SusC/RagA family outer membrane protein